MPSGQVMIPKDCEYCGEPLDLLRNSRQKFHKKCRHAYWNKTRRSQPKHQEYMKESAKRRWSNMPDDERRRNNERAKSHSRKRRMTVIQHYGGVCECCGENKIEFLALDHKNGDGNIHRRKVGSGNKMYKWVIDNDFPDMFRVLCHNCNMSLGLYGYCPHENS